VDSSALTALGNDYGFETIFSRQVEAFATPNDAIVGISTSGNSKNIILALNLARNIGSKTIGFMGNDGGDMKDCVDVGIIVPSNDTARIQEVHITIGHIICEIIEQDLIHENKI
jgi:D-sedoheptulose 7-phosphate isomerase